jgi:hypothetical protein
VVLQVLLAGGLVVTMLVAGTYLLLHHQFAVDIEIPLRAAERWLSGGQPYDPAAFDRTGVELPFLYPPFTLPLVAPLVALPRLVVHVAWVGLCLLAALLACRRLGLPVVTWPVAMLWPPFAEAVLGGNVQVLLFAAYCLLFWPSRPLLGGASAPSHADASRPPPARHPLIDGVLATVIGALKVSQFQPWLALVRHRPMAAFLGASVVLGLVVLTLPLAGLDSWFAWLSQAGRAGDPEWAYVGEPLSLVLGRPIAVAITAATAVGALLVPWRSAGIWIGILILLGAPSLHIYGWLFLLPALLVVRREIGLLGALLIATYQYELIWTGFLVVTLSLVASRRLPGFLAAGARSTSAPA